MFFWFLVETVDEIIIESHSGTHASEQLLNMFDNVPHDVLLYSFVSFEKEPEQFLAK